MATVGTHTASSFPMRIAKRCSSTSRRSDAARTAVDSSTTRDHLRGCRCKEGASGAGACEKIVEAPGGDESWHPHPDVVVDSRKLGVVRPRVDRGRLRFTRPEGE